MAKRSRSSSGIGGLVGTVVGAGVYGAFRQKLSDMVKPMTQNVPFLGNLSDEIVLGGAAILLDRTVGRKMPILKPVLKGAIVIEAARIGEAIATGQAGIGSSSSTGYMLG
jgi:hypothetical protein